MPPLTHGRVYNDFRSGLEQIKDQNGNVKATIQKTKITSKWMPKSNKINQQIVVKKTNTTKSMKNEV